MEANAEDLTVVAWGGCEQVGVASPPNLLAPQPTATTEKVVQILDWDNPNPVHQRPNQAEAQESPIGADLAETRPHEFARSGH
eukprot:gene21758-biopygen7568